MNTYSTSRSVAARIAARSLLLCATLVALLSCGGGGGGGPTERAEGVYTGFSATGNLDWELGSGGGDGGGDGGGVGGGADGDGGVGGGGDFGQFRNALLIVKYPDGSPVGNGQALTDAATGMVTIVPRKGYAGPLYLELRGTVGATYYEEGKDTFVPFPEGQVLRTWIPKIDKNIGITPFTETAYRLLTEGATPEKAVGPIPTAAEIAAANERVRALLNQQFPAVLAVDDITRLPFIKSPSVQGQITTNPRGVYGLVNGAFSKQAAMFNPGESAPTLAAVRQLSEDLLDGKLDGLRGALPAVAAGRRTYDPNTLTGELTSALAEQSERFGTQGARGLLPKVINFGNSRYEGYLFDASLKPGGEAVTTVAGWVTEDRLGRPIGTESPRKLPGRVFGVYGNLAHGGVFLKANASDSQSKLYGLGDNVAGELGNGETGLGTRTSAGAAVEIKLPTSAVVTHVAGGFAHTVARLADGSVYTWGDNSYSQLGQGVGSSGLVRSETPIKVNLPMGAIAVSASNTASYALLEDGRVYSWGSSWGFGLLGDGVKDSVRDSPGPVLAAGGVLSDVVHIAARDNDAMVTKRDGTVWTWGSFPSESTFDPEQDPSGAFRGGSPLPTQIKGLNFKPGVQIRKIIAEQGLFAVLTDDGAVYTWGVHFDITAQGILRDESAVQVLGLPKVRDLMPGGFIGYGSRPFDRQTAMAIDYRGNMWKVRGRVAEQFDPANPQQQRRPQRQSPRPDCANCHLVLTDWPLTAPGPTTTNVCVSPPDIHGTGSSSLIHADTACEQCHNPARTVSRPSFTNGWLNCVRPTNLPARPASTVPATLTTACIVPVGHVFTPPGTVCASCHNSVIARPLQSLGCAQPPSSALPSIKTTVTIVGAFDESGREIKSGTSSADNWVELRGTLSLGLSVGQSLRVFLNGDSIGSFSPTGTEWELTDPKVSNGLRVYTARVEAGTAFGPTSNSYVITIDTVAPTQTTTIAFADDVVGPIASPGFTSDTTPTVTGTLSAAVAAGESVRVYRSGTVIATVTPNGTNWSFTEPTAIAGATYSYTAHVVDAAGNLGPLSNEGSLTVVTNLPQVTITGAINDRTQGAIASGGFTNDTTPVILGSLSAPLGANQLVRVLRDGVSIGTATSTTTSWTFTDPGASNGAHTYTARSEQGSVFSALSGGYAFTVDTVLPTQTANVTQISDDISGNLAEGASTSDTTPTIAGRLSAALGANETLQVLRGGAVIATLAPAGTTWTFTEPSALASATYVYSAKVVDAAGNTSLAVGTTRSVILDTLFKLAGATTTLNTINGVAPSGGEIPQNNDSTPTLTGTLQRALYTGERVRVYRGGASSLAAEATTVSGTSWSYVSPALADGTYSFLARIEQIANSEVFGQPSASVSDSIDATAPTQTLSVSATSNVAPNTAVTGAVPESNVISTLTNDPTPTITVVLSSALGTGETLTVTRQVGTGSATPVATFTSASECVPLNRCFQFTHDDKTLIPLPPVRRADPLTPGTTPNTLLPTSTYSFTARVSDKAGNNGTNTGSVAFALGYFDCDQVRANTIFLPVANHTTISAAAAPNARCSGCHRTQPADSPVGGGTPVGAFVAVPTGNPPPALPSTYWCKRPR